MAGVGLSKCIVAKYAVADGAVSYSAAAILGKAVEFSTSLETGDDNNLYADNAIAESDRTFGGGTLTISTDDLTQEGSALILGITPSSITVGTSTVSELVYDDTMVVPDLGYGTIIKKKVSNDPKYRAVVLAKIKFNIPDEAATTQGETIEWQVPSLTATIMRDDSATHKWKREATFDTEAAALAYIEAILGEIA